MIKGSAKKMFILKNMKSRVFDEAYFIVKEGIDDENIVDERDMISEANRIIDENDIFIKENYIKKAPSITPLAAFLSGAFLSLMLFCALYFIFA